MRFEKANCAWNTWFTEFNYEDLEEIVHLEFIGNASRYIHTHYAYAIVLLFIPYRFLVRMMIKLRIAKENEKEDTMKRPQQNV